MLTYINIKNFAIIKELEVDLQSDMTVLTGETGAGKSIIIDTLELALGARADTSMISNNADRCEITLIFDLTNLTRVRELLIDQELDSENECIIRRIITNDGRSKSSVNGNPCTQQILRTISELLLNIHGQHEHQALLNPERQRELLDAFADSKSLAVKVKQLYNSWLKIKKELIELENLAEDHPTKIDYLTHQLNELEHLDFSSKDLDNLHLEQKRFSSTEQIAVSLNSALEVINDDERGSVISSLYNAKNDLEKYKDIDPQMADTLELLQNAIINSQEAVDNIRHQINSTEFNEERHMQVEEQLTFIHDLAHKHHVQPQDLSRVREDFQQQLDSLKTVTVKLEKAQLAVGEIEKSYLEAAENLSAKRKHAAKNLNVLVTAKMQDLGMIGGKFSINFLPNANKTFSASGLERIEFLVSANPGQPLQPLNKVASGGELSRISLAIQVITAEKEVTPTLIFDEIDAGVGGKTADIVGQLLRKLSEKTQVICITHLPQVAAQGHDHVLIEKTSKAKNTEVALTTLNQKERINEIARMLGGVKITQQTLAHAKEMLNAAI
jgi:DNA repair protein RecN (Recombination protein N)